MLEITDAGRHLKLVYITREETKLKRKLMKISRPATYWMRKEGLVACSWLIPEETFERLRLNQINAKK